MAIVIVVSALNARPVLQVWHSAELDEEFTADSSVDSFAQYLALEGRLFAQLRRVVYDQADGLPLRQINRYQSGSVADPGRWERDWNRSFEMAQDNPIAGVLLIHGMSDSPYSMRTLAERVHGAGAYALGLRVPGHGTAPSSLRDVKWQDMAAAVRLASRHVQEQAPGAPLVIIGYSNGGALAIQYALEALEDEDLPLPARIVLLSPEIGLTALASLAVWQERLGHLLGLEKLAWNSIVPEYDPFKYGSFALNAGKQAYLITCAIQKRMTRIAATGGLDRFPPTLAFQSAVDATIRAPAIVSGLFDRLPAGGHELVLFDINRYTEIEPLLVADPTGWIKQMLGGRDHPFTISALVNESRATEAVTVRRMAPGMSSAETVPQPGLRWPPGIFSLSHVALPFPPDDPVYGGPDAGDSPGIHLGDLALRGERGVLQVSGTDMLRLRWNPFYDHMAARIVDAVVKAESPVAPSDK